MRRAKCHVRLAKTGAASLRRSVRSRESVRTRLARRCYTTGSFMRFTRQSHTAVARTPAQTQKRIMGFADGH